jgi:hypothetical protein
MRRKRLSVGLTTKEGQAVGGAERAWSHNTSDSGKATPENRGDTIGVQVRRRKQVPPPNGKPTSRNPFHHTETANRLQPIH